MLKHEIEIAQLKARWSGLFAELKAKEAQIAALSSPSSLPPGGEPVAYIDKKTLGRLRGADPDGAIHYFRKGRDRIFTEPLYAEGVPWPAEIKRRAENERVIDREELSLLPSGGEDIPSLKMPSLEGEETADDYKAAVSFYKNNQRAALFDLRRRLAPTPIPSPDAPDSAVTWNRKQIYEAAQVANARFGQWMPQRWIDLFIQAYEDQPQRDELAEAISARQPKAEA